MISCISVLGHQLFTLILAQNCAVCSQIGTHVTCATQPFCNATTMHDFMSLIPAPAKCSPSEGVQTAEHMFDIDCGVYAHIGTSRQGGRDTDTFPVNSHILVDVYAFVKISMPWRMKEKTGRSKVANCSRKSLHKSIL